MIRQFWVALVIVVGMFCHAYSGPYTNEINGVQWNFDLDDYGAVLSSIPVRTKGVVCIPSLVQWVRTETIVSNELIWVDEDGYEQWEKHYSYVHHTNSEYVVDISTSAFRGCKWVTSFEVAPDNDCFKSQNGVLYNWDMSILIRCPPGYKGVFVLPETVTDIAEEAFEGCEGLTDIVLPSGLVAIKWNAFQGCRGLMSLWIPASVRAIDAGAFSGCVNLTNVVFEGDAPDVRSRTQITARDSFGRELRYVLDGEYGDVVGIAPLETMFTYQNRREGCECEVYVDSTMPRVLENVPVYDGYFSIYDFISDDEASILPTSSRLLTQVDSASTGWNRTYNSYYSSNYAWQVSGEVAPRDLPGLPETWGRRRIRYKGSDEGGESSGEKTQNVCLTVTNVVVHYVFNSVQPNIVEPVAASSGIVNIIAEVKSGAVVAIPESWAANYPGFFEKFGSDFTKALMKETGKRDSAGNPMFVWQDYVVGTDPTDVNDIFTASITMVDGSPLISWTPELPEEQAQKRSYVIYGKVKLQDADWTVVVKGREADYNFFKVVVEMK